MATSTKIHWSANLTNMVISAFLWFLYASGLVTIDPDQVSTDIVSAVIGKSWPLLIVILYNFGTTVYYWVKTWKTDKPNFTAFLTSVNFWLVVFNIGGAFLAMWGVVIPPDAGEKIAGFVFNKNYIDLTLYIAINILLPVIKKFVDNTTAKGREKLAALGSRF